MKQVNIAQSDV